MGVQVVDNEVAVNEKHVGSRIHRLTKKGTRVRIFYPTTNEAAESAASGQGKLEYAPYGTDGRSLGLGISLTKASSGCVQDAPLAYRTEDCSGNATSTLPLLIYSHGIEGNMDAATQLFRTLSKHGVVVAALEHTDGTATSTVRQDGTEMRFSPYMLTERRQLAWRAQELLEAVDSLPDKLDSWFEKKNVVGPVVLGGHGYGGTSAVMAANGAPKNSTVCGLILHDPTLGMGYGMLPPNKAYNRLPAVTYVSDKYNRAGKRYGARTLHVRGGRHESFLDTPLWGGLPRWAQSADPLEVHEQLAESMAAFVSTRDATSSQVAKGSLLEIVR